MKDNLTMASEFPINWTWITKANNDLNLRTLNAKRISKDFNPFLGVSCLPNPMIKIYINEECCLITWNYQEDFSIPTNSGTIKVSLTKISCMSFLMEPRTKGFFKGSPTFLHKNVTKPIQTNKKQTDLKLAENEKKLE